MIKHAGIPCGLMAVAAMVPSAHADSTATNSVAVPTPSPLWQKPVWLTDLSGGYRQSYNDNILLVSGLGLGEQYSWVSTISAKVGFDFAPLLDDQKFFKSLTFVYLPEIDFYYEAPQENYNAQRIGNSIKASAGDFSFSLDNAFLYNDGSREAPIYAESQPPGNTNDRFRNFYAQAAPRERRNQIQDRGAVAIQYDLNNDFFVRAAASTLYYNLNTILRANVAPFVGYQNWPDRYDANGGLDGGYRLTPHWL